MPDLVFRDPYMLDFLGLRDTYSEQDLESALLREIEPFLLKLGVGFAFVERQKRITLDGDDYYLDLLFYHRLLRRLVVIELKIGDFKAARCGADGALPALLGARRVFRRPTRVLIGEHQAPGSRWSIW